ncbi:DNA polymerase III, alpha subunit [Parvibaculum lavamentivorans DS-1]|uniref:Error-prone DNA polymerase n=1 Tax=Parvibaculum lavamentivorans (strain DS-1 / DSM 13023 / NCIMB 13966) TaxID=402881 RepID=A7HW57_PARL1|nr:error-prone DNA polymerase [Parvibaculum lavamentivorans]ABS64140.1 DNA polymerase III, alpha subunit [Parvibaculum lavamentivorans DS-1]
MSASFAELAVATNFSFLRGASHAEELVLAAKAQGLSAIGIADRNTLAGIVRAHAAAKEEKIRLLVGARLVLQDGFEVIAYPQDRAAYGRLTRLLTLGNRRAPKGECFLAMSDLLEHGEGHCFIAMPPPVPDEDFEAKLRLIAETFPDSIWLGLTPFYRADDVRRHHVLELLARKTQVPLVATNDVLYHSPDRKPLHDVVTCVREHCTLKEAGFRLAANAERHVKSPEEMSRLLAHVPKALSATFDIVERCSFSLEELRYEYPADNFSEHETPQELLVRLTWEGARDFFSQGVDDKIRKAIDHELKLIEEMAYAPYFLTVHDIVRYARSQNILCQGRGSAANSTVCFCLGITSVNPSEIDLLFERFISKDRNEPPDIDVDFEHERREEVIQYIYEKYGRHRAGIAATVISYRSRSAIRDVGKVFGLSEDVISALSRSTWGWSSSGVSQKDAREIGLDPSDRRLRLALKLAGELIGFPRHLSQHVGGFVITKGPLDEVVPIQNAAMDDRTFVEWDKDDLDTLGILKIDVLALGMLTCIRKAFEFIEKHYARPMTLAGVPQGDKAVYDMLCEADAIGVFQVESRAQMSMLPRLKPRNFYDLVVEVAIVRPGPIQGDMVHPYLRRRSGKEEITYPSSVLEEVLERTYGVPLFQEQAMKIAIVAAGFTPGESDQLRRAMATFRKSGTIGMYRDKFIAGMLKNGYKQDFAERCFKQIEGFADYGFPESHAASFARLAYISAWLKYHYPDAFCAALLNSQPMGFYAPAQLVRDASEHGVEVRPVDVNHSDWDCTLEKTTGGKCAVRLGLRQVKGVQIATGETIEGKRGKGFDSIRHLWLKTGLGPRVIEKLADADAFRSIGFDRREALWAVRGLGGYGNGQNGTTPAALPLFATLEEGGLQVEEDVSLPAMPPGEHVVLDYAMLRLSLKAHPISFLRPRFAACGAISSRQLKETEAGKRISIAGLVLVRQRPGTASGVIFATLEDETGIANIIIWPKLYEKRRRIVLTSRLLFVRGRIQKEGIVIHIVADDLEDWTHELAHLSSEADIGEALISPADGVKHPGQDPRDGNHTREEQKRMRAARFVPKSRDFH